MKQEIKFRPIEADAEHFICFDCLKIEDFLFC